MGVSIIPGEDNSICDGLEVRENVTLKDHVGLSENADFLVSPKIY